MSEAKKKTKEKDAETLLVICKEKLKLACELAERYRNRFVAVMCQDVDSEAEEKLQRAEYMAENRLPWEKKK